MTLKRFRELCIASDYMVEGYITVNGQESKILAVYGAPKGQDWKVLIDADQTIRVSPETIVRVPDQEFYRDYKAQ